ncbi:MAG: patatin [Bacteroidetes bacterium]|nr:MAG: patatin [Bacteroidota bacterium]
MAKKKIILSIDGGGIRGIVPGQLLTHVERLLKEIYDDPTYKIADHFDLIAGTSTGGILACAYLLSEFGRPKYTADEVVNIYLERGDDIFSIPLFHKIRTAGGVLDEKYPAAGLEETLKDYFGDAKLSDLLKPSLITAYDIKRRKAHFFTQHDAKDPDHNFFLRDVARATSSAPTYFEVSKIKSDANKYYPLIDGGIFANNPALCAFAETRNKFSTKDFNINAADILLLSLGTGYAKASYSYDEAKDWGLAKWTKPALDMMMAGVSDTVDYQLKQIFEASGVPNQYLRLNAELPVNIDPNMDCVEPENLELLKDFGDSIYKENQQEILRFLKM